MINNRGIGKFEKLLKTANFEAIKRMLLLYQPDFLEAKAKGEEMLRPTTAPQQESTPQKAAPAKDEPVVESDNIEQPTDFTAPSTATETHIDFPTSPTVDNTTASSSPMENQQEPVSVQEPDTYQHEALLPGQRIVTPTSTPLLGQQDIIAPLNNVLDPSEIWLLRRVFKVLNSFCPDNEHDQNLIAEMERLIVKEFNDEV